MVTFQVDHLKINSIRMPLKVKAAPSNGYKSSLSLVLSHTDVVVCVAIDQDMVVRG